MCVVNLRQDQGNATEVPLPSEAISLLKTLKSLGCDEKVFQRCRFFVQNLKE